MRVWGALRTPQTLVPLSTLQSCDKTLNPRERGSELGPLPLSLRFSGFYVYTSPLTDIPVGDRPLH
jgi:hypothetical protein